MFPDMMFDNRGAIKVEWLYEGDSELFTLICVKRHIDRHFSTKEVVLEIVLPQPTEVETQK